MDMCSVTAFLFEEIDIMKIDVFIIQNARSGNKIFDIIRMVKD